MTATSDGLAVATYLSAVQEAGRILGRRCNQTMMQNLEELLEYVNPRFPDDALSKVDALLVVIKHGLLVGPEDLKILESLLPTFNCSRRAKFYTNGHGLHAVKYSLCPKKSGAYYEITFASDAFIGEFPMTVRINVYANMDDQANHGPECPRLLDEWSDCDCETPQTREISFVVTAEKWAHKRGVERIQQTIATIMQV